MSRHLFWLSEEAWAAIEPHLPRGRPGNPVSTIGGRSRASCMSSGQVVAGGMCRMPTVRPPRSTTASTAGPRRASGAGYSRRWPPPERSRTSFPSTAPM